MVKFHIICSSFCLLLFWLIYPSDTHPLCTDLRAPTTVNKPLAFCPYNGTACCDSAKDLQLQKKFAGFNISDSACASAVKSILCAACDQFSAELYKAKSGPRPIPVLCNTASKAASTLSKQQQNTFCSSVWDACENVPILNSPFAPSLQTKAGESQNSTISKLTDLWQSKDDFCEAVGGSGTYCFGGEPVKLNSSDTLQLPNGMCLEKIGSATNYINMVPHPDGSSRAFFSNQPGKIWLATIPEQDSGEAMGVDESSPFSDLTDQVYLDAKFGMMGMAFHPKFAQNGRFFASFNCDKSKSPGCVGRCACNSDVGCDPSKIGSSKGSQPCQFHSVIAEFSANGTSPNPSMAEKAKPTEVRRIFTLGLPYADNYGGQIQFGPDDGYMYVMLGDGGNKDDPFNFAQKKKSLLGKILRLDVDNIPSQEQISDLGLWGNYSIPRDNPYMEDKDLAHEIWALGLRNPWRCSFDAERPSYFLCGDVGQDQYEEVDVITKGGNYGWRDFEGPIPFEPKQSAGGNNSTKSIDPIFPVLGYNHTEVNKDIGSAAISGGFFYRSQTDPCIYGSYLYGDLYAKNIWAAAENPKDSGNFTKTDIPFSCAHDSPLNCSSVPNSHLPAIGVIFSFAQDNKNDIFILTSTGVYRIVRPSRCSYNCPKEKLTVIGSPPPPPSGAPSVGHRAHSHSKLEFILPSFLLWLSLML